MIVETARLVLRPVSFDDVDQLVELDADPAVMHFINGGRPTPRAEMVEVVRDAIGHRWVAFARSTGKFVGWFALRPSGAASTERELGYRLRRGAWGQGLATEGSRALVDLAFERLAARRVWAQTMTVNVASRRVMEHCGLTYVRTFHQAWPGSGPIEGSELGDVEYERLRTGPRGAAAG